jgi:hypothetical protein
MEEFKGTNQGFFGHYGNSIEFTNVDEFQKIYSSLDITVEKRTHDSSREEQWIIMTFLGIHLPSITGHLPLKLIKSQQPDFLLEKNGIETFGIEITESTHPMYLAATALAHNREKGEWPVDSYFKYGNTVSYENLPSTLQNPEKDLHGEPWIGDEGIRNTASFLKESVKKKIRHLNENPYQGLTEVQLLVYFTAPSSLHTSNEQITEAYPQIISEAIKEAGCPKGFSKYHLLWSKTMKATELGNPFAVLTA